MSTAWIPSPAQPLGTEDSRVERIVERGGAMIIGLIGSVLVAALLAAVLLKVDSAVSATGSIEPAGLHTIRSPADGFIAEIRTRPGDSVSKGQVLAMLDETPLSRRRRDVRLRMEEEQLAYMRATRALPLDLLSAAASERIATARVSSAIALVRRRLAEHGYPSEGDIDSLLLIPQSNVSIDEAAAGLRVARAEERVAKLESARRAADSLEIDALALSLDRSRAELKAIEEDQARLVLRAPVAGMVFTEALDALPGRYVRQGEALLELGSPSEWRIFLLVDEGNVRKVEIGQAVRIELLAADQHSPPARNGTVVAIASDPTTSGLHVGDAGASGGPPAYRVEVKVDRDFGQDSIDWLRRGLSVRGRILTGRERLGMQLLKRLGVSDV